MKKLYTLFDFIKYLFYAVILFIRVPSLFEGFLHNAARYNISTMQKISFYISPTFCYC